MRRRSTSRMRWRCGRSRRSARVTECASQGGLRRPCERTNVSMTAVALRTVARCYRDSPSARATSGSVPPARSTADLVPQRSSYTADPLARTARDPLSVLQDTASFASGSSGLRLDCLPAETSTTSHGERILSRIPCPSPAHAFRGCPGFGHVFCINIGDIKNLSRSCDFI
jgi:hypothetical protein